MKKKLIFLGATGGCADLYALVCEINDSKSEPQYETVGFLDDREELQGRDVLGLKVIGKFQDAQKHLGDCHFVTGIGSALNFWKKSEILANLRIPTERFETLIHPQASVSKFAKVGLGCTVFQHSSVSANASIGNHVLILPGSVINHDSKVGSYTTLTSGVCLSGNVTIDEGCYVGSNSAIRQDLKIGKHSLIGMGSTVLQDVPNQSIYAGNPAKFIRATY